MSANNSEPLRLKAEEIYNALVLVREGLRTPLTKVMYKSITIVIHKLLLSSYCNLLQLILICVYLQSYEQQHSPRNGEQTIIMRDAETSNTYERIFGCCTSSL